ncbi:LysR substrate-binding domain-containing protein [Pseudomonas sp. UMAB-40]|uniref:LysR substrate-binding domain-containing protein n=1 Tax=Pseudomonas sp. UMAB-40 TaxID=1365407 RepID=UPI001C59FB87|nr:LysR substrate-binding domain-containing protein [Pseudomonas sp. UMAB-40]
MELRHLRYFLAVAEEGHFGRAAAKLHIVQPALSMQIRSLEEELGTPLFTRTSRKVMLTEAGEILVIEARRTLDQAQRAKDVVQKSARGEIGSVRIGFSGNASFAGKLSCDLGNFHRQFPEAEITLREASAQQQAEAILAGELDVGYCPTFDLGVHADLRVERIGAWPWVVAMSGEHPLAKRKAVRCADLMDETFVVYSAHGAEAPQLTFLRHILGKEPKVAHYAGSTLAVLTIASAGLGLGLVPAPLSTLVFQNIQYRPLAGVSATADLVLIYRTKETSGAVKQFLTLART